MTHIASLPQGQRDALLSALWERSVLALALVGENGRFLACNTEFCNLVEYSEVELVGRSFLELTHPDDHHPGRVMTCELLKGQRRAYRMKKRYITKTNRVVWVMLDATAVEVAGNLAFCLSQVAPDALIAPNGLAQNSARAQKKPRSTLMEKITKNWAVISAILAALGLLLAEALKGMRSSGQ